MINCAKVEATIVRCKDIAKSLGYGTSIGWNEFEQQSKISESPSVKTQSSPSSNKKSQIYKLSFTPNKSSDIICNITICTH